MFKIQKVHLIVFSVLIVTVMLNCVKREHSNPLDPKYVVPQKSALDQAKENIIGYWKTETVNSKFSSIDFKDTTFECYYHAFTNDAWGGQWKILNYCSGRYALNSIKQMTISIKDDHYNYMLGRFFYVNRLDTIKILLITDSRLTLDSERHGGGIYSGGTYSFDKIR